MKLAHPVDTMFMCAFLAGAMVGMAVQSQLEDIKWVIKSLRRRLHENLRKKSRKP